MRQMQVPSRLVLAAGLLAFAAMPARADVKPHPLFSDHMVLQRGANARIWGTADPGEEVKVTLAREASGRTEQWSAKTRANDQGAWKVELKIPREAGPYTLVVEGKNKVEYKDVLAGEVWICSGQSNMGWTVLQSAEPEKTIAAANHPNIRLFKVPLTTANSPQKLIKGNWEVCTPQTIPSFSAVAYHFGRELHAALGGVPIGLINTSWGGTPAQAWTSKESLDSEPALRYYHEGLAKAVKAYDPEKAKAQYETALQKFNEATEKFRSEVAKAKAEGKALPKALNLRRPQAPSSPDRSQNSPSTLYNAMIAPLVPFAIQGAIWYQGESNAGKAYEYRTLFPLMIQDWRKQWKQGDFPFLLVQLAPFASGGDAEGQSWPELREAQLLATKKLPNVGMAVITDVGERDDIHPKQKAPVGARLSRLAEKIAYGKDIVAMGPVYKSMTVEGDKAVLSFTNVGQGLACKGEKLTGFTIAGEDRKFYPAEAVIQGDRVVVSSPQVSKPVAVRYGWANYPVVNLWNKNGLPATPFRTDDWPGVTWPKEAKAAE